jgi:hypothetical protein
LHRKKSENGIPPESVLAWPQISSRNLLRTLSDVAVIAPHLSDRDALYAAIDIVRRHPERWREFQGLVLSRGWLGAALVCVFDCQWRSLRLRWGEQPPCVASTRGKGRAARLLRRMLKRGISRYHPNPLAAIEEAGALDSDEKGTSIVGTPGASSAA